MLSKALVGSKKYYMFLGFLLVLMGMGGVAYAWQLSEGLGVTGLSRDVSWGLYIAQLTFLVGVAASAVMVVLPYYWHDYKAFGKITILGEFLAIAAVIMCMTFVFVDMGQPTRVMNVMLHPTLNSPMFWDFASLTGYMLINLTLGWTLLHSQKKNAPPPKWIKPFIKPLIYISVPWAVSIHTVTAFLYAGLPGRHLWLTAVLAPRFLASAFAAGPSLLIILCLIIRKVSKFDPGKEPIQKLAQIVAYAMTLNLFFLGLEFFTAFFSGIPSHQHSLLYLFFGLHGGNALVPWMWTSMIVGVIGVVLLINPSTRKNESTLGLAVVLVFLSTWIDKGVGLIIGGFIPNPFDKVVEYVPSAPELMITVAIYAMGAFILTILYKIAISVREDLDVT